MGWLKRIFGQEGADASAQRAEHRPHVVPDRCAAADAILAGLPDTWKAAATSAAPCATLTTRELAARFRRRLPGYPELVGMYLSRVWIEHQALPAFCQDLGLSRAPAWKDFARQLKHEMPKKRLFHERGEGGKRVAATFHAVPDPNAVPASRSHVVRKLRSHVVRKPPRKLPHVVPQGDAPEASIGMVAAAVTGG
jgi:hypothetical protein